MLLIIKFLWKKILSSWKKSTVSSTNILFTIFVLINEFFIWKNRTISWIQKIIWIFHLSFSLFLIKLL